MRQKKLHYINPGFSTELEGRCIHVCALCVCACCTHTNSRACSVFGALSRMQRWPWIGCRTWIPSEIQRELLMEPRDRLLSTSGWWVTLGSALALLGGSEGSPWNDFSIRRCCDSSRCWGSTCLAALLGKLVARAAGSGRLPQQRGESKQTSFC